MSILSIDHLVAQYLALITDDEAFMVRAEYYGRGSWE